MSGSIAVVVVTYNRLSLLKKCIDGVRNQTLKPDAVIVINNGSTDGTDDWLGAQGDLTVITQSNVGGAGGFHRGIKEAFERKFDWIWVMDDDGCPALNCLEELMAATVKQPEVNVWGCIVLDQDDHSKLAFECSKILTKQGEINWDDEFIDNWAPFFNGILFSRATVKKVGLPNPSLFIWGDEIDYYEGIVAGGGIIKSTTRAVFYHPKDRLYSTVYRNQYVYDGPINWKAYCFFRNRAYLGRKHYHRTETGSLFNQFAYFRYKLPTTEFLKAVPLLLKAHLDGLTYNLKRKLPY